MALVYCPTVGALRCWPGVWDASKATRIRWCAARAWVIQLTRLFLSAARPAFITSHGVTYRAMLVRSGAKSGLTNVEADWSLIPSRYPAPAAAGMTRLAETAINRGRRRLRRILTLRPASARA
jgi:hypothetical protein